MPEGHWYGFPVWGIPGFKIGRYHHMQEVVDPDADFREPRPEDEVLLRDAIRRYFPAADGPVMSLAACMFTNTPDEHFVLDTLPGAKQGRRRLALLRPTATNSAVWPARFSRTLAETGTTRFDIAPFSLSRLTAPA